MRAVCHLARAARRSQLNRSDKRHTRSFMPHRSCTNSHGRARTWRPVRGCLRMCVWKCAPIERRRAEPAPFGTMLTAAACSWPAAGRACSAGARPLHCTRVKGEIWPRCALRQKPCFRLTIGLLHASFLPFSFLAHPAAAAASAAAPSSPPLLGSRGDFCGCDCACYRVSPLF